MQHKVISHTGISDTGEEVWVQTTYGNLDLLFLPDSEYQKLIFLETHFSCSQNLFFKQNPG